MTTVGEIKITRTEASRIAEVDFDNIPFGRVFSDHMLVADYSDGTWQSPGDRALRHAAISTGHADAPLWPGHFRRHESL